MPPNQVKVVRDVLQKLVHEYATPDQEERDEIEKKRRAASRRETAICGLVARLDRTLILSTGQRERILRVLDSNWDEEWCVVSGVIDDDPGPLPAIPDRLIVPCLSPAQQRAWGRIEKQGIDATFAYVAAVEAIMDGIPSEFSDWLEAAPGRPRSRRRQRRKITPKRVHDDSPVVNGGSMIAVRGILRRLVLVTGTVVMSLFVPPAFAGGERRAGRC